jgi:diguanylate cyclase (GGDEF)-like protein
MPMNPALIAPGQDPWLVLASLAIATFASYVTQDLVTRMRFAPGRTGRYWWLGGTLALGTGIWAMHFVGMLGFRLNIPLGYDSLTTLISWLAALLASGIALAIAGRRRLTRPMLVLGSVSMACAICGMHYLGMAAMDMAPGIQWNWPMVGLSVLVALVTSAAALGIFFGMRRVCGRRAMLWQLAASLVMGLAIAGMHYTGMAAANFPLGAVCLSADQLGGEGLAVLVSAAAVLMLTAALLMAVIDARMQAREALMAGSLRNANEQLQSANDELHRLAFQDALTGLPNRALFQDRLQHAALRLDRSDDPGKRQGDRKAGRLAVLFIDLDGFKPVDDSYGHAVGDLLLKQVAQRLQEGGRGADTLARIGGDEFVLLMEDVGGEGDAAAMAQRLIVNMARPFEGDGLDLVLSCSIGIALYPDHGNADKLVAAADAAMYNAKRSGGAAYTLYDSSMGAEGGDQVAVAQALRHAIERQELQLHYQPKVVGQSGEVHGVEALLRWTQAERGSISPAVFIPIAERFGVIVSLGNWVIDEACAQMARWRDENGLSLHVAINLSAYQLRQADLVDRIQAALARHGLDASQLVCEITETVVMDDSSITQAMLDGLAQIGVTVSIDDFGVGYSSLAYLRRLPARQLKVDRSFVMDVDHSADARAVVEAVVRLAHALGLQVVAEGVETAAQRDILQGMACDLLQGFYLARPMPAAQLVSWLAGQALVVRTAPEQLTV